MLSLSAFGPSDSILSALSSSLFGLLEPFKLFELFELLDAVSSAERDLDLCALSSSRSTVSISASLACSSGVSADFGFAFIIELRANQSGF